MCDQKKETLKSFLTNNLELNESIKSNSSKIPITPLSKIELMIMYLKLNINTLKEMDFDNKELIIDIVENDNYLIIEFDIYSNDKLISIECLSEVVKKVSEHIESKKFIDISKRRKNLIPKTGPAISKVIDIRNYRYRQRPSRIHLEKDFVLTPETSLYIRNIKTDFIIQTNNKILDIIFNRVDSVITPKDIKFIYSLIIIYSLIYFKTVMPIPYNNLNLSRKGIYDRIITYTEPEIISLERQVNAISVQVNALLERKVTYSRTIPSKALRINPQIDKQIDKLYHKEMEQGILLSEIKKSNKIFNKHILEIIFDSLNNHTIEILPDIGYHKLSFFTLKGGKISNNIEINTSDFIDLIHNQQLLSFLDEPEYLLKK